MWGDRQTHNSIIYFLFWKNECKLISFLSEWWMKNENSLLSWCTVWYLHSTSRVNSLSPECVFELNRARERTTTGLLLQPPLWFLSLSASVFIYPFCDADLAACWPPQSAGSFGALRNDSTLSLSDLPACWLQLLLTNSQAESAPEKCFFSSFLPAARFHTFTYRTICSWSVYATPSFFPLSCPHQVPTWAENRCQTGAVTVLIKVKFSPKSSIYNLT